jgi:diacylglycerol kinase family enzyme
MVRAALRFVQQVGTPDVRLEFDHGTLQASTQAVSIANAPYVGAALAVAPAARVDDGVLEVSVIDRSNLSLLLTYLVPIAGGRPAPPLPNMRVVRTRHLRISVGSGQRPLQYTLMGCPLGRRRKVLRSCLRCCGL